MKVLECRSVDGAVTAIPMDRIDSIAKSPYRGAVMVTTKSGQEHHIEKEWSIVEVEDWDQVLDKMFAVKPRQQSRPPRPPPKQTVRGERPPQQPGVDSAQ